MAAAVAQVRSHDMPPQAGPGHRATAARVPQVLAFAAVRGSLSSDGVADFRRSRRASSLNCRVARRDVLQFSGEQPDGHSAVPGTDHRPGRRPHGIHDLQAYRLLRTARWKLAGRMVTGHRHRSAGCPGRALRRVGIRRSDALSCHRQACGVYLPQPAPGALARVGARVPSRFAGTESVMS
jgi:hypothetical protein